MKWFYVTVLAIVVLTGSFFLYNGYGKQIISSTPRQKEMEILIVLPQPEASTTVFIERIAIKSPGFLAVRSIENGQLGQIIEISSYLIAEEHLNIAIDLGEFYNGNTDLIVVVYDDANNDQIFNDLDQPMVNSDNNVIARYVKTGTAVATQMFTNIGESASHMMGGMKMETVRYTNLGYVPNQLEIPVGTMVQFINESDDNMWVASSEHPGHTDLPTFDQFTATAKTSVYRYTFDQVGTWSFHDHLKPEFIGIISVI